MNVYLVSAGGCDDFHIVAAFSNFSGAQRYIESSNGYCHSEIIKFRLDPPDIPESHVPFMVACNVSERKATSAEQNDDHFEKAANGFIDYDYSGTADIYMFAEDHRHAYKIALKRLAIMLGDDLSYGKYLFQDGKIMPEEA